MNAPIAAQYLAPVRANYLAHPSPYHHWAMSLDEAATTINADRDENTGLGLCTGDK